MNPLLIESLARQQASQSPTMKTALLGRFAPRRRPWVNRFGEVLIDLGTKLAFARLDRALVGVRESW
jgi:hypothetical protein